MPVVHLRVSLTPENLARLPHRDKNGMTSSVRERPRSIWIQVLVLALALAGAAAWLALRYRDTGPWVVPEEARAIRNPVPMTDANIATGAALYADNCARCHGDRGDGDGPDAKMNRPQPASLALAMRDGANRITDGEMFWKIAEGRRPMPSFKKELTDEQRWQLVNFLRTLATPRDTP
jgi:mono/diheme cytochrome c family protein